jgi:hypothetical protein
MNPVSLPADVPVLAEHAAQVAAAEEDCPRPARAAQAVFLAVMRQHAGHAGIPSGLALS